MKRRSLVTLLTASALVLTASACGDDNLEQQEAAQAFATVLTLSQSAGTEARSSCTTCVSYEAQGRFDCPGGGTVGFVGETNDGDPILMDLSLDYAGCTGAAGITVDGNLAYSASISTGGDFTYGMNGDMSFTGQVEGTCNFALSLTLTGQTYSATGDLCGSRFSYP